MSKTLTGLRYRLSPHPGQERILVQSMGACRWLWNWALDYRETLWLAARSAGAKGFGASVGYVHMSSLLPGLKDRFPWLAKVPHHCLQSTLRDLDYAFEAFFKGRCGFPKYRRKGDGDSIRFPDPKQFKVDGDWVKLPKLGWTRFRLSRPICGNVRNITLSRVGSMAYVSFCVEADFSMPNAGEAAIGLDLGVAQSVTTSLGEVIAFPVATREEDRRLRWLQRQAARRSRGSARRRKAIERVAMHRRHIANRRRDAAHKLTTHLATKHAVIAVEDLRIKAITASASGTVDHPGHDVRRKAGLNRALLSNAHFDFRRMLAYKCERSGAQLVAVNPSYTSQQCSQCRHRSPENRKSQAVFLCVACGFTVNADINAAINILAAGQAVAAQGGSGVTPADELRTHPRDRRRKPPGSTGIPANAAQAA